MKTSKQNSRKSGIRDSLAQRISMYGLWETLFLLSSVAFLLFWVMVHALAGFAGFSHYFGAFSLKLVIASGISTLSYLGITRLPRRGRLANMIAASILIIVFIITLMIPLWLMTNMASSIASPAEYFSTKYADEVLIRQIIGATRFLGHGSPVAEEVKVLATSASIDADLWEDHLLIMTTYTYGFWMVPILFAIVAVWCVSAGRIYLKIYSRWHEWVFVVCFIAVAYQMIPPLLFVTGLLEETYQYEAFYHYYVVDSIFYFVTNPLAAMLAVIKRNHDTL